MDIIQVTLGLPTSSSADVVKKVITVNRVELPGELTAVLTEDLQPGADTFVVEAIQDTEVSVKVVAVDDAGNESEPVTSVFTALDTVPPVLEGGLTAKFTGERSIPDGGEPIVDEPTAPTDDAVEAVIDEPAGEADDTIVDEPDMGDAELIVDEPDTGEAEAIIDEPADPAEGAAPEPDPEATGDDEVADPDSDSDEFDPHVDGEPRPDAEG